MESPSPYEQSKFLIGFLMLPLGIIGLLIGMHEYPKGTRARKTFLRGMFVPMLVVVTIMLVLMAVVTILAAVQG